MPRKTTRKCNIYSADEKEKFITQVYNLTQSDENKTIVGAYKKAEIDPSQYTRWQQQCYLCSGFYKKVSHLFPMYQLRNRICVPYTVKQLLVNSDGVFVYSHCLATTTITPLNAKQKRMI